MTEEELAHYGVLGMKWGQRQKATGKEIQAARRRLKSSSKAYRKDYKKYKGASEGTVRKANLEKKLRERHQEYLKNPDRVIASRMTRGEKFSTLYATGATGGIGIAALVGTVGGSSAVSRRIEFKQERGDYNKMDRSKKVQNRIGFQRGRALMVGGAVAAPGIIKVVGPIASSAIIVKAGVNRNAAKLLKPSIGSAASKIKFAKPNLRGVHNITTMK